MRPLRGIAFALLLALSAAAAPSANHGRPSDPVDPSAAGEGCLQDVEPTGSGFSPGELRQAASLHRSTNRSVDFDRSTLFAAIALAQAYNLTLEPSDVSNFTTERLEVCAFSSVATVEGREALLGSLVGRGPGPIHLGEARLLTVFRTTTVQNVTLVPDVAFAAIALKNSGAGVALEDVITFHRQTSTTRTLERLVNITDEQLLLEIALGDEKRADAEERARQIANRTAEREAAEGPGGGEALPPATPPPAGRAMEAGRIARAQKRKWKRWGPGPPGPRQFVLARGASLAPLRCEAAVSFRGRFSALPYIREPAMGRRTSVLFTKATPVRTTPSRRWSQLSAMLIAIPSVSRMPGAMKPRSVTTR